MTALGRLEFQARTIGNRTAIQSDNEQWSYAKLWDRIERVAAALERSGIGRGDAIGLFGDNSPEYLGVYFGVMLAGGVTVPMNTRALPEEATAQLDIAKAAAVVVGDGFDVLKAHLRDRAVHYWASTDLDDSPREGRVFPSRIDPALCVMTTGTTGLPKGVIHTHASLGHAAEQVAFALPFARDEVSLAFLPFSASIPEHALPVLLSGGSLRIFRTFDVDAISAACSEATSFHAVPTVVGRLLNSADHDQLRKLRWMSFASEPMPTSTLDRWRTEIAAVPAHQFYGMTEVLPISYASPRMMSESPGTVGRRFPSSRVTIVDSDLNPLPPGEVGEVVCKSPAQMLHYLGRPDLTANALTPDGFMRTGDLGTLDDRGRLHLTGRLKDLIISGGLNISPAEIEAVACRFPGVAQAAVIGAPDAQWGETPLVVVVPLPGIQLDLTALLLHCKTELAAYKRPSAAAVVPELPLVGIGKADKPLLRRWLAAGDLHFTQLDQMAADGREQTMSER